MKYRDQIEEKDDTSEIVEDAEKVLDDIESQVIEAFNLLDDIDGVGDLSNVGECLDILRELKKKLY